jgi:glycine/D-amino acid oxidase-like deaminating enzyme
VPGYGHHYWADRTVQRRRRLFPTFRGDATADVVVIGGGLTGATAAYVLAAGGLDVVLLEAERIAAGSTAASLGAIVPEPDVPFRQLDSARGLRVARAVSKQTRRSALDMGAAIRRLAAKRDLSSASFLLNARDADIALALKKEQAARKAAGVDASWLSAASATADIGTMSAGALRSREAFLHDPVRTTLGFADEADENGARIFERSVVRKTTFTRKYADVILKTGKIRTRGIYVATGTPGGLFRQLKRHVREEHAYVVVTEPLSAQMRRDAGKRTSVLAEAGSHARWLRWLSDNRAMFAGASSTPPSERQAERVLIQRTGQLMYELSVRYPVISGLPARWSWPLPIVQTADGVPWIGPHRNFPFHFFTMALGWNGDAYAWLGAKAALRHFTGEASKDDLVFQR